MAPVRASIIINNYNYAHFLRGCIESALAQSHSPTEVIVVDDGSTDDSRAVIESFGSAVHPLFKSNEGQASTFNAGFAQCGGDVILYLDADDLLLPSAVENAVAAFAAAPGASKVHWPLWEMNEAGDRTGNRVPAYELPSGDLREEVLLRGPLDHAHSPTSGNAWSRAFLEAVLPVQEWGDRHGADAYLVTLAPIFGPVAKVAEPQSIYRRHGKNFSQRTIHDELAVDILRHRKMCAALQFFLARQGVTADLERWTGPGSSFAWMLEMQELPARIQAVTPGGAPLLLVDEDQLGAGFVPERKTLPFPEKNGFFSGTPENAGAAIAEVERQRKAGAAAIIFIRSTRWWLEHFPEFQHHLRSNYSCVADSDRLVVFDLRCAAA